MVMEITLNEYVSLIVFATICAVAFYIFFIMYLVENRERRQRKMFMIEKKMEMQFVEEQMQADKKRKGVD